MTSRSGQRSKQAVVAVGGAKWPELNGRVATTPTRVRPNGARSLAFVRMFVREGRSSRLPHLSPTRRVRTSFDLSLCLVLGEVLDRRVHDFRRENPSRALGVRRTGEGRAKVRAQNLSVLEAERLRKVLGASDRTIDLCITHTCNLQHARTYVKGVCERISRTFVRCHSCIRTLVLPVAETDNALPMMTTTTPPSTPMRRHCALVACVLERSGPAV